MPSDLDKKIYELEGRLGTLDALREEDRASSRALEKSLKDGLSEVTIELKRLIEAEAEAKKELRSRLDDLEALVGEPSEKAKQRHGNAWTVLEKPFYKQPAFVVGLSTLPGILVAGFLLGEMDLPKLSYWSHKLLGTHDSVVTALEQDPDMVTATEAVIATAAKLPDSSLSGALDAWLDTSTALSDSVKSEIFNQFSTISMSQMSVGVANYNPELFAGEEAVSRVQRKFADRVIPVPPETEVDIIVTVVALKFDLSLIDAHADPALLEGLDIDQQIELSRRIRPSWHFYLPEMPRVSINGQDLPLEPVLSSTGVLVDDSTSLPALAEHTFRVAGYKTPAANGTTGTAALKLDVTTSDLDAGDTEWKYVVTINRVQS